MSFIYNANTWTPKSANAHSVDVKDNINSVLTGLGLTNLLNPLVTNILWILCLAIGNIRANLDLLLYRAQQSFNISNCDDTQILNLLPIAGTTLTEGTYTIGEISVTASGGTCEVPAGSSLPFINNVNFLTQTDLTILAGATETVKVSSDTVGAVVLDIGQLTSFNSNISNLGSVTNLAKGITGRNAETITEVRQRIINGKTIDNNIEGTIKALRDLDGINDANLFFNPSASSPMTLPGSISLAARHTYVIVLGTSDDIAKVYLERMTAETQGGSSQDYTLLSGQDFTVNYNQAAEQNIYVNIFIPFGRVLSTSESNAIKQIILDRQSEMKISQVLTSAAVSQWFEGFNSVEIVDTEVGFNGTDWFQRIQCDADSYPFFDAPNIVITNLSS